MIRFASVSGPSEIGVNSSGEDMSFLAARDYRAG